MKIKNKQGLTLSDAFPAVLTVALVAILFIALIYMFTAMQSIPANSSTYTTINESFTVSTAGTSIGNATKCGFSNFAVTSVYNSTGTLLSSGNYTANAVGTIANTTSAALYGTSWYSTYTYTDKGSTCTAAATILTQYANQIPLVGLVLTIVLIAVVIGVLISSFYSKKSSRI